MSGSDASVPAFKTIEGVSYRIVDGQDLLCDLYVPSGPGPFPVALLIHGGGWSEGNRKQLRRQAEFLAGRGIFGMAIDYRLAPAHPAPAALQDSSAALVWLRDHAAGYHIDAERVAAIGSSAGGNIAALLGVATTSGQAPHASVRAVVSFNGIYDLRTMPVSDMVERYLGKPCAQVPAQCAAASPETQVRTGDAAFLVLHGTADKTAPYSQATSMVQALQAAHDPVELFTAVDAPHTFWIQPRWTTPSFEAMYHFLQKWIVSPEPVQEQTANAPQTATHVWSRL